jgi:hypothetical protein
MYFLTLIVETVNSVYAGRFVISSQEEEVLGIEDLIRKQQADGFKRILPTIYIVSEEQVVISRREASVTFGAPAVAGIHNVEESQQIVVLTVDVTCHHSITQVIITIQTLARITSA